MTDRPPIDLARADDSVSLMLRARAAALAAEWSDERVDALVLLLGSVAPYGPAAMREAVERYFKPERPKEGER